MQSRFLSQVPIELRAKFGRSRLELPAHSGSRIIDQASAEIVVPDQERASVYRMAINIRNQTIPGPECMFRINKP